MAVAGVAGPARGLAPAPRTAAVTARPGAVLAGDALKVALAMGAAPAVRKLPGRRDA
ncbi:hypothetical protein [Streptomyces bohaiensis]|uniref:hypothetical protein n=1 Tax=Streptomyces bohaiensis TaxID=1431344 RepID=UPI003B7AB740